ncbi:unnamed protein product, partial [Effrenium voratum]
KREEKLTGPLQDIYAGQKNRREGEDQGRGLCEKKQVVKETIVVLPESRCGAAFGEVRASVTDWLKLHEQDLAAPEIVARLLWLPLRASEKELTLKKVKGAINDA